MPSKQQQEHSLGVWDALTLLHAITTEESMVVHEHSDFEKFWHVYKNNTLPFSNKCFILMQQGILTCCTPSMLLPEQWDMRRLVSPTRAVNTSLWASWLGLSADCCALRPSMPLHFLTTLCNRVMSAPSPGPLVTNHSIACKTKTITHNWCSYIAS